MANNNTGLIIALILMGAIVVFGLIGGLGYYFFIREDETPPASDDTAGTPPADDDEDTAGTPPADDDEDTAGTPPTEDDEDTAGTPPTGTPPPPSGVLFPPIFGIKNEKHDRCIDSDGGKENGDIYGWQCDVKNNAKQRWIYDPASKHIRNANSNKCMDLNNSNTGDGTRVAVWTCDPNNQNQKWTYNPQTKKITHEKAKTCLDLGNGNNGQKVVGWNCSAGSPGHQEWTIIGV